MTIQCQINPMNFQVDFEKANLQADSLIRAKRRALFRVRNALRQAGVRDVNRSLVSSNCSHNNELQSLGMFWLEVGILFAHICSHFGGLPQDFWLPIYQKRGTVLFAWGPAERPGTSSHASRQEDFGKANGSEILSADLPLRTLCGRGAGRDGSWRRWKGQELHTRCGPRMARVWKEYFNLFGFVWYIVSQVGGMRCPCKHCFQRKETLPLPYHEESLQESYGYTTGTEPLTAAVTQGSLFRPWWRN